MKSSGRYILLALFLSGCSGCNEEGPETDTARVTNTDAVAALEQLEKETKDALEQLDLPPEQLEEVRQKLQERDVYVATAFNESPYAGVPPEGIEDTLAHWLSAYRATCTTGDLERINDAMAKDPVMKLWIKNNKVIAKTYKNKVDQAVKACAERSPN